MIDWIDNLPGQQFLGLYALAIVATLIAIRIWMRRVDVEHQLGPVIVPSNPDPFEAAFLHGGKNAVGQLALLDLLERGWLQPLKGASGPDHRRPVVRAQNAELRGGLSLHQTRILEIFDDKGKRLPGVVKSRQFRSAVADLVRPIEEKSEREKLLVSTKTKMKAATAAVVVIMGLGGFKLVTALLEGRSNVGFLIVLGVVGFIALLFTLSTRLTTRGKELLDRMQAAYRQQGEPHAREGDPEAHRHMLAMAGLFGVGALMGGGMAHAAYAGMVNPVYGRGSCGASNSSSGCSSCSGGDGGGDGGGGGCGGGGCGGCGGD